MGMGQASRDREILLGWDVRDVDDELVGTVIDVAPSYVLVEQGRFFPDDVYIPRDAIAAVDEGVVRLNVPGQRALDEGWHTGPPLGAGFLSTEPLAPGIALGGHVEDLGTTEDDAQAGPKAKSPARRMHENPDDTER